MKQVLPLLPPECDSLPAAFSLAAAEASTPQLQDESARVRWTVHPPQQTRVERREGTADAAQEQERGAEDKQMCERQQLDRERDLEISRSECRLTSMLFGTISLRSSYATSELSDRNSTTDSPR